MSTCTITSLNNIRSAWQKGYQVCCQLNLTAEFKHFYHIDRELTKKDITWRSFTRKRKKENMSLSLYYTNNILISPMYWWGKNTYYLAQKETFNLTLRMRWCKSFLLTFFLPFFVVDITPKLNLHGQTFSQTKLFLAELC